MSASTVSRYFNHPEILKSDTRKKIDSAVRRTGYIRNRAAQTIHGIRSGTIGVLVPTLDHAIFAEVVQAFSDEVAEQGFTILLASHGYDAQGEYAILRKKLEHRVDGIVLSLGHHDIACMLPPVAGNDRANARRAAVMRTLNGAGVQVRDAWQLTTVYSIAASKRDTIDLLSRATRPTAIICGNDILATGAIYGARAFLRDHIA